MAALASESRQMPLAFEEAPVWNAGSLETAMKTVAGTARSMGLDVVG